jgi:arginine/lysine/ornithine decarboxylase
VPAKRKTQSDRVTLNITKYDICRYFDIVCPGIGKHCTVIVTLCSFYSQISNWRQISDSSIKSIDDILIFSVACVSDSYGYRF